MKKASRNSFTLIEIIIALTLVALAGSLITINGAKFLKEERFRLSSQRADTYLSYAKDMAIIHNCDVFVIIKQENGGLLFEMGTDSRSGFSDGEKPEKEFVSHLKLLYDGKETESLNCCYCSTGRRLDKGKIRFVK